MCNVLHIEDSSLQKTLVDMIFAKTKDHVFNVEHASTMEEALQKYESGSFDIIVADLNLPDSDREATIPTLREHCKNTPIIVVSCEEKIEIALQAVRDGVDCFLNKSWELKQLPYTVLTVLEKRKMSQEVTDNFKQVAKSQMSDVKQLTMSLDKTISKSRKTTEKLLRYKESRAQYG